MTTQTEKPWYRHFWVWFVLAPLIATVLGSAFTFYLAGGPPALVVDDFGTIAMAVERDQQRDRRATDLRLAASLRFAPRDGDAEQVTVWLDGAAPERLRLDLIHPTLQASDQRALLERSDAAYAGTVTRADTRLYVELTDETGDWRLTGVLDRGAETLDLAAAP